MGQPNTGNAVLPLREHIARVELTGRTETSKYPQEEKAIAISSVVASEMETA